MSLNLELSKLLWEKGVRLETEMWWVEQYDLVFGGVCPPNGRFIKLTEKGCYQNYSSPSTDDLLVVLPAGFEIYRPNTDLYNIQYRQRLGGKQISDNLPHRPRRLSL